MRPIERVLLVGRDAPLWLTALGLQRAFGRTGVQVQVVELPTALSVADVLTTTPALQGLHRLLGLDEARVLAACSGTYNLAQRFSGWSGNVPPFFHAYDTQGARLNNVEFVHYWTKARREGLKVAMEDFSLGAAAAKAGRFVEHTQESERFSKATYGYRLQALSYVALVKQHALRGGVAHTTGEPAQVQIADGAIQRVVLDDGRQLEADLYIDACDPEAILIGELPQAEPQSWRQWLPCDRVLTGTARALAPLPGFSEIAAFEAGWIGLHPLQGRTGVVAAYDSSDLDDDAMIRAVRRTCGLSVEDVAIRPFATGFRAKPWCGNCVAIGGSALRLHSLDATYLHHIHLGLSHLVSLFPTDADHLVGANVYNTLMREAVESIRDFQIAHFKLNGRTGESFWDRLRAMSVPDALQYKIDAFCSRGLIPEEDNEVFQFQDWLAILTGHGLLPQDYDPLVDRTPQQEQIENFQRMLRFIAAETKEMPSLQAHLEMSLPSSRGSAAF